MIGPQSFFLFDLDGTLVRLGWAHLAIAPLRQRVRELMTARGLTPPMGMMIPTLAELGRGDPAVQALLFDLEDTAAAGAEPCPGAAAVLAALAGRPCAVVSNNGAACVDRALQVAGLPVTAFGAVLCREDVTRCKPDPEPLRRAVAVLTARHGPPQQVLMIGDAATDIQAAHALAAEGPQEVLALGVLGGVSTAAALTAAGATRILGALDELLIPA